MKAEILTIGDEILSGNIINTNSAYLSDRLWSYGIEVAYHSSVRDEARPIKESLQLARQRSDLVLVSGGLGPTADDFTIEIAAQAFNKKLVQDKSVIQNLKKIFKKLKRPLAENNLKQALIPEGAKVYPNKIGTAPGIGLKLRKKYFYFLPGVPSELKSLFENEILPEILKNISSKLCFKTKTLHCFGKAESELDRRLRPFFKNRMNLEDVRLGYRAHFPETSLKLSAWNTDPEKAKKSLYTAEKLIKKELGDAIYGSGKANLETVLIKLLRKNKKTIALAESCTGGFISHRMTNVPGSSEVLKQALVTYSNEAKRQYLKVSTSTLKNKGAVSESCAREMLCGLLETAQTNYGIAVTGIAGPGGGTTEKPVGLVYLAFGSKKDMIVKRYHIPGGRDRFKLMVSSLALDQLRRFIKAS